MDTLSLMHFAVTWIIIILAVIWFFTKSLGKELHIFLFFLICALVIYNVLVGDTVTAIMWILGAFLVYLKGREEYG